MVLKQQLKQNKQRPKIMRKIIASELYVMGSADLLQTLFKNDLVDEMELMIIPITLGTGKRLFQDGTIPASFNVTQAKSRQKASSS
jgi:dihydrofolate reductase